jgi:poly-D-alanine transfer protein DltD
MSEEIVQETTEPDETDAPEGEEVVETKKTLNQLSQDELIDYVKSLRKENASHRTEKQATRKELEEFQTWKDSQKSDLQRAQEEAATLKDEKLSLLKLNAALAYGLDEDMVEFVKGDTADDIQSSAKKLADRFGNAEAIAQTAGKKSGVTDVFAGSRGTPVSEGPTDPKTAANNFMAQLIWGSGQ